MIPPQRRIDYLPFNDRPVIRWPNGARLAFWVVPNVEYYEYVPPAGTSGMRRGHDNPDFPAPNVPVMVRRDYGNRVGFWRMLKAMDKFGIRCTVNINLALLHHFPEQRDAMVERGWDFCCHGMYNTRSAPKGMSVDQQRRFVTESIALLAQQTGKRLKGFNVLGRATEELPDILAEHGIIYHADYFHDDQPTPINVSRGKLVSIPYGAEINDSVLTSRNRPWESDTLFEMAKDAFDRLYAEGERSGMVLCLPLHPWCSGYPYRIRYLERIFDYVMSHDGVWQTTADEIAEHYIAHHYDAVLAHIARRRAAQPPRPATG
ncbi:MAG: polysaccharide deacetylase family protein [Burkholderiales bacterium]|nr:polysaccharide deacetylase family protein [Burkholderiales bacterium]